MPLIPRSPRLALSATLFALAAWPGPASADAPKPEACITAHEQAQSLRHEGQLRAAHEKLLFCAQDGCPGLIKSDCAQWVGEVADGMPTVVLAATDPEGHDIVSLRVLFDGREIASKLDGRAVPVDPGVHTLRYERVNGQQLEEKVVIREGEKNRIVSVRFPTLGAPPAPSAAKPVTSAASSPPRTAEARRGAPVLAFVLGGVGLASIGAFAYLGATASSDVSDMRGSCAPDCDPSRVDSDKKKALFADIALGVGVVSLGAATYLLVSRPSSRPTTAASVPLDVRPLPGGAMASFGATF